MLPSKKENKKMSKELLQLTMCRYSLDCTIILIPLLQELNNTVFEVEHSTYNLDLAFFLKF